MSTTVNQTAALALPSTPRRSVMLSLLIKDFRLCKPAIIAGLIALFIPVIADFLSRVLDHGLPHAVHPNDVAEFRSELASMIYVGLALATVTLGAVAAMMLARERRDRSGEFLRTLPIPRRDLLGSKVIVLAFWSAALWIGAHLLAESIRPGPRDFAVVSTVQPGELLYFFIALALCLIALAWFFASFLRSDAIATALAIGITIALLVALFSLSDRLFKLASDDVNTLVINFFLFFTLAAVAFTAGCGITLRRRSP